MVVTNRHTGKPRYLSSSSNMLCVAMWPKMDLITPRPVTLVAEYCDERVCLYVCVLVRSSVSEHISRTICLIFTNFFVMLSMAVARSCSGGVVIRLYFWFYG